MHNFSRPTEVTLAVLRSEVPGTCGECGSDCLAAYRVLSEGGWWNVVKCQNCLHSLSRVPGPLLGSFVPLEVPR